DGSDDSKGSRCGRECCGYRAITRLRILQTSTRRVRGRGCRMRRFAVLHKQVSFDECITTATSRFCRKAFNELSAPVVCLLGVCDGSTVTLLLIEIFLLCSDSPPSW